MYAAPSKAFHEKADGLVREYLQRHPAESRQTIADCCCVSYRTFCRWLEGHTPLPAEKLPLLCEKLEDDTLLDELEQYRGRVGYRPETPEGGPLENLQGVTRLVKEVSEALQALTKTMEDHVIEERELDSTLPAIDDVIRECCRLKALLTTKSNFHPSAFL